MNILALADRRPKIDILQNVHNNSMDVVIILCDLTREDILPLELITSIPKIGVYGNHDSGNYMNELGIWDMHLKIRDFNGLKFGGFQGCVRYKDNPDAIMYTQEQAPEMMDGFPKVDIFISHCPPRGINDEEEVAHQGFSALRSYLDSRQPKAWLHGHTYPTKEQETKIHGATRIEYVYEYKLITL